MSQNNEKKSTRDEMLEMLEILRERKLAITSGTYFQTVIKEKFLKCVPDLIDLLKNMSSQCENGADIFLLTRAMLRALVFGIATSTMEDWKDEEIKMFIDAIEENLLKIWRAFRKK